MSTSSKGTGSTEASRSEDLTRRAKNSTAVRIPWVALWRTVLWAAVGMIASELLTQLLVGRLTLWESHAMTILEGSTAAGLCTYFVMRKHARLLAQQADTEAKLALERNLLRTVTDNIPDSIFVKDRDGRYTFANRAFTKLHRAMSSEELLGKTVFDLFPIERAEPLHAADLEVLNDTSGTAHEGERSLKEADGTVRWIQMTKVALVDQGNTVGIVGVNRDITRRKLAEAELVKAKEAAEAASEAKSSFLATMSHEIRTPMNGILGLTGLVLDSELTAEQRENLELVQFSAEALLAIINDILDFSKIEAGKLELEAIPFDLRTSVGETMKALSFRAHQKGLELIYDIRPEAPDRVIGDPGRLRQILTNLIGNSIKFTERGEILITVEEESNEGDSTVLLISVKDTGIGIPADKQARVFESFSQGDSSTTRKYGGTGLGLAICSRLVEMMGGHIWLGTHAGPGCTFSFTVKFEVQRTSSPYPVPVKPQQLRDLRALIVDDNSTNRRVLLGMLTNWGMKPTAVEDGAAALEVLTRAKKDGQDFPLILLDGQMPEMDGFELAERIRKELGSFGSTVMMLTSAGRLGDAARCRELGVSGYLGKPVLQGELLEAICRVLANEPEERTLAPLITRHALRELKGRSRVLLAEDNAVNRTLAVRLLERRGFTVSVVCDGRAALQILEKEEFDFILMDVEMPELDGFQVTAAIREKEKLGGGHIPIIAMTAHVLKGDQDRCLAAGMDGYVSKPIRTSELMAAIEKLTGTSGEDTSGALDDSAPVGS
jgi:two-component system sensor histidine kinase/response regulator